MIRVDAMELQDLMLDLLIRAGASDAHALRTAQALTWAETAGRATQGLWRLPVYLDRLRDGSINGNAKPKFRVLRPSVHSLEGDNALGPSLGALAMERACELAALHGIGVCLVNNSNHFGAAAYFAWLAAERKCMSLVTSNSFPKVAAPKGKLPVLGTNPFAFGAPSSCSSHLLVDFSTAELAGSTLTRQCELGENKMDSDGPMQPAAGGKGFGLALMVESLSGILAGAASGSELGSLYQRNSGGKNGHAFIAIDSALANDAPARLGNLLSTIVAEPGIRHPGQERARLRQHALEHGVNIPYDVWMHIERVRSEMEACPKTALGPLSTYQTTNTSLH